MHRFVFLALFPIVASLGCAVEAAPSDGEPAARPQELFRARPGLAEPVPFCLPGEKRVCTLGPPPVCHCEPETPGPSKAFF